MITTLIYYYIIGWVLVGGTVCHNIKKGIPLPPGVGFMGMFIGIAIVALFWPLWFVGSIMRG